jgi:hypothetical protein
MYWSTFSSSAHVILVRSSSSWYICPDLRLIHARNLVLVTSTDLRVCRVSVLLLCMSIDECSTNVVLVPGRAFTDTLDLQSCKAYASNQQHQGRGIQVLFGHNWYSHTYLYLVRNVATTKIRLAVWSWHQVTSVLVTRH